MRRLFRKIHLLVSGILAVSLTLSVAAIPAQAATTLKVGCGTGLPTDYATIGAAVTAAAAGPATITVCAGTYAEQVLIDSVTGGLKLMGKPGATITIPTTGASFNLNLVYVTSSTDVIIQGFTVDGQNDLGAGGAQAIVYSGSSGSVIKNHIVNWTIPSNSFASTTAITDYGSTALDVLKIVGNTIGDYQGTGMFLEGPHTILVSGNTLTSSQTDVQTFGIQVQFNPTATISGNKLNYLAFPASYSSVGLDILAVSGLHISGNTLMNWDTGIQLFADCSGDSNNNLLTGNKVLETGIGIYLQARNCSAQANNNIIRGNRVWNTLGLGTYGIHVEALLSGSGATGEVIMGNSIAMFAVPFQQNTSGGGVVSGIFGPNSFR